jgi:hypothetical protein
VVVAQTLAATINPESGICFPSVSSFDTHSKEKTFFKRSPRFQFIPELLSANVPKIPKYIETPLLPLSSFDPGPSRDCREND